MSRLCELCGNAGANKTAVVEGARVVVCDRCASLGKVVEIHREKAKPVLKSIQKQREEREVVEEVVEDIGELVKNRREELGLKQEELGKKISESASLVKRIEHGFVPNVVVARKLQRVLGVRLVENVNVSEQGYKTSTGSKELTLGDLVVIRKEKRS